MITTVANAENQSAETGNQLEPDFRPATPAGSITVTLDQSGKCNHCHGNLIHRYFFDHNIFFYGCTCGNCGEMFVEQLILYLSKPGLQY